MVVRRIGIFPELSYGDQSSKNTHAAEVSKQGRPGRTLCRRIILLAVQGRRNEEPNWVECAEALAAELRRNSG